MDRDVNLSAFQLDRNAKNALYVELADQIETMIRAGIAPGSRLPSQRALAQHLGINLTTVTRAFRILLGKGLVSTRAGRGTTVNLVPAPGAAAAEQYSSAPLTGPILDLTVNRPASGAYMDALAEILAGLVTDPRFGELADYQVPEGPLWLRQEIARWMASAGALDAVDAQNILITNGAQHALHCVLRTLCKPGEHILADAITYQGVIALCPTLGLEVRGVAMDAQGMAPEALEAHCRQQRPAAVFLVPTLHNPTAITLSAQRRKALAEVARKYQVPIIEDDVYRCLYDAPIRSLTAHAPEQHFYLGGFSKCVAPGLRIGFIHAPATASAALSALIRNESWCISPLNMLVAMRLLESGALGHIIAAQKAELRERQRMLTTVLDGFALTSHPSSSHAWLRLPPHWNTTQFVSAAHLRGVAVLGSDLFALDERPEPAVRLNIGAPRSREDLRRALELVRETLEQGKEQPARPGVF